MLFCFIYAANTIVKVKFIGNSSEILNYSSHEKSICQFILRGCNIGNLDDPREWWNTIRIDVVKRELTELRSNKQQGIFNAQFGKFVFIVCIFCLFC